MVVNRISDLLIRVADGLGNPVDSTVVTAGVRALNVNLVGGGNLIHVSDLGYTSPISVANGQGAVFGQNVVISIANAKADGSTKGAASFKSSDFNDDGNGLISFDYNNGQLATDLQNGLLSAADHASFAAKQGALTIGNLTEATSSILTILGGTGAVVGSGVTIQVKLASATQSGYLASTDFSSFAGKQPGSSELTSIAGQTAAGILVRVSSGNWTVRTITPNSNKIAVTNGSGASGNPLIDINEANIVHQNLSGAGTNTHAQIDLHIGSTSNPHSTTATQVGLGSVTNDAQVKKISSSTIGNIPTWAVTTGDQLADSYGVDSVSLSNSNTKIPLSSVVKAYADSLVVVGGMGLKGSIDCSANPNYPAATLGSVYVVSVAGKIGGASGIKVEAGDILICLVTSTSGDQAAVGANWNINQANLIGAVTGPGSSVNNRIATFNGITGLVIADSGYFAQDATTSQKGLVQLSNSYSGTSQLLAVTEKALSDGLSTKQATLSFGNLTAGSTKLTVTGGSGAVVGSGTSIDINEANIVHQNLSGAGTNTHAQIDLHIGSTSNPHSTTATQVGLGNVTNNKQIKSITGTTVGYVPTWGATTGDLLATGYAVDTVSLSNSGSTIPTSSVVKAYADALVIAGSMVYKGVLDCSTNPNYPAATQGWTYFVSVAGKIGGASGVSVEIGDMVICLTTNSGGTQAQVGTSFNVVQFNIVGAVTGPTSSVANRVAIFNDTTGKVIADSGYLAQDASTSQKGFIQLSNSYSGTSQLLAVTEKALSDGLATKQSTLTLGNLTSANTKLTVTGGTGAVVGSGVTLTVNEANIVHQNLSGAGTNTHAQIDLHIASTSNPHSTTATQVGLGNVTNDAQVKKLSSSTIGNIPYWSVTTGDALNNGYGVETTLIGGSGNIPTAAAVKNYADALIVAGSMVVKGSVDCSTNPNYPAASSGAVYKVSVAGKIGGASGVTVEAGDMLVCIVTSASGDQATVGSNWNIVQSNIINAVTGPGASVNNRIVTFNGTSGLVIADSGELCLLR